MHWNLTEILVLMLLAMYVLQTLLAHGLLARRLRRREDPGRRDAVLSPISIIKPVRGLDQEAEENFLSFMRAEYPAPLEIIFSLEEREDPAAALIQRLIANGQSRGAARLVFSQRQDPCELGKTINLIAGVNESSNDVLVFSDSDVRNTAGFLAELVRPLSDPRVGLSYACPVYRGAKDWVAWLMALSVNETILPLTTAPPFAAIGSAMAIRKDVLDAIGGLAPLRHRIGVDGALGRAVHARGYRIELIRSPVTIIHPHGRFLDWWRQIHRWLVTIRIYLGLRYFGFLCYAFPILWASSYASLALLRGAAAAAIAVLAFILLLRLASFALVNLVFVKEPAPWRYVWLLPLLEVLTLGLWLESWVNRCVMWRGRRYRVMSDATVVAVRTE